MLLGRTLLPLTRIQVTLPAKKQKQIGELVRLIIAMSRSRFRSLNNSTFDLFKLPNFKFRTNIHPSPSHCASLNDQDATSTYNMRKNPALKLLQSHGLKQNYDFKVCVTISKNFNAFIPHSKNKKLTK